MRMVLLGDIIAVARALMPLSPHQRGPALHLMLDQAHAAHSYIKRCAKPHPDWGNGSLMSRANRECQVAEPFGSEAEYLITLQCVIAAILRWKMAAGRLGNHPAAKNCATQARQVAKPSAKPDAAPDHL